MNKNKTILIFIDWFEPGFKAGGPIRSVSNLVKHLSDSYNFRIVTRNTDYTETEPYTSVESDIWVDHSKNVKVYYLNSTSVKAIHKMLKHTSYDMIYLNSMYSLYYSIIPMILAKFKSAKVVLAPRGMLSEGSFNVKQKKKRLFIQLLKFFRIPNILKFHSTGSSESQDIRNHFPSASIIAAQNFPSVLDKSSAVDFPSSPTRLINIGRISPEKNTLFAVQCLEQIKNPLVLDFYGPVYNESYYNECKSLAEKLPDHVTVKFKGVLMPNLISETLSNYHFFFSPSTGENFGHAIVESLSCGVPVIISDKTPWRDLEKNNCGFDLPLEITSFHKVLEHLPDLILSEKYGTMKSSSVNYIKEKLQLEKLKETYHQLFG